MQPVTRCLVTERGGFVGGLVFGIPFVLPLSSVHCVCGECGHEFHSRSGAEDRAVPPEVAAGLDIDALLGLTNPDLWQARTLSGLRADPRLPDAFLLLDRLAPGPLRFGLRAAVARWPASVSPTGPTCSGGSRRRRAEGFARSMAGRYTIGAAGCLAGVAVAAGVWVAAGLTFVGLGTLGWALVAVVGLVAGGVPGWLLSQARDRWWVRDVLLPEADRAGVLPAWVLAVVEGTTAPRGAGDELGELRGIGPASVRSWPPGVGALRAGSPGSGHPPAVIVCPGCGAKVRVPVDRGAAWVRPLAAARAVRHPRSTVGPRSAGPDRSRIRAAAGPIAPADRLTRHSQRTRSAGR